MDGAHTDYVRCMIVSLQNRVVEEICGRRDATFRIGQLHGMAKLLGVLHERELLEEVLKSLAQIRVLKKG